MTQEIEFKMGEWLYNAGLVGFINIVGEENVRMENDSVYCSREILNDFETKYFNFFIRKYKKTLPWYRIVAYEEKMEEHRETDFEAFDEKALAELNDYIKNVIKKYLLSNSYKRVYELIHLSADLLVWLEELTVISLKKQETFDDNRAAIISEVEERYRMLDNIIAFCKSEAATKYLPAQNVIYTIIKNAWSGVSFLNPQTKERDVYIDYREHFVRGAEEYLEADLSKAKDYCFTCNRKILKMNLDYSFLNDMGFDTSRKTAHVWGGVNNDAAICPLCKLVYSCVPAGFVYAYNQGVFINSSAAMRTLIDGNEKISANIHYNYSQQTSNQTYRALLEAIEKERVSTKRYELVDIQIINYDKERYSFNLLSKRSLYVMMKAKKWINALFKCTLIEGKMTTYLYQEVMRRLMNNENLFRLIDKTLYYKVTGRDKTYYSLGHISAMLEINTILLKEMDLMPTISRKQLLYTKHSGNKLRLSYLRNKAENKMSSITYKLQNALRTNNKSGFVDILLTTYVYIKQPVPNIFIEVFEDDQAFKSVGYAFLLGFNGETDDEKENGGNTNEK